MELYDDISLIIEPKGPDQEKEEFFNRFNDLVSQLKMPIKDICSLLNVSYCTYWGWKINSTSPKGLAAKNQVLDTLQYYIKTGYYRSVKFSNLVRLKKTEVRRKQYQDDEELRSERNRRVREIYEVKTRTVDGIVSLMLSRARCRAREKNIEFSLTAEDINIIEKCPVLGITLNWEESERMSDNRPSLDRINSDLGYTRENSQVISWKANRTKNDASLEDLVLIGQWAQSVLSKRVKNDNG